MISAFGVEHGEFSKSVPKRMDKFYRYGDHLGKPEFQGQAAEGWRKLQLHKTKARSMSRRNDRSVIEDIHDKELTLGGDRSSLTVNNWKLGPGEKRGRS